jgi:hypothetical protein
VGNEQLDGPNHSSTFVVLAFWRSSSRAGGLMTWASVSRLLKGKCRSNTKKRALFTNNRAYTAEALRCCWSWKEMAPNTTPKSRSMGNVERNLPKSRLNGAWWFMMFASSSEKTSHQTTPSASPQRSARLIGMILSLWSAPKMRPNTPPSTISKKKPANQLMVGSAMVIPNQCNASGKRRPGVPSVTKSSVASTRPAKSPATSPLRSVSMVSFSFSPYTNQLAIRAMRECCPAACSRGASH